MHDESDDADDEQEHDDWDLDDGEEGVVNCPYCQQLIYDDAERCPACNNYLSQEELPAARKPWWIVAGAIVCLYLIVRSIFFL